MDFKTIDEAARRVMGSLPAGFDTLRHDLERNMQAALRSALARMDLVTREEFEVQEQVLLRTRAKLDALEQQVRELEARIGAASGPAPSSNPAANEE